MISDARGNASNTRHAAEAAITGAKINIANIFWWRLARNAKHAPRMTLEMIMAGIAMNSEANPLKSDANAGEVSKRRAIAVNIRAMLFMGSNT